MPLKANQHQNFTHEVLPLLFHNETAKFFTFLDQDGIDFLKFWWNRAGVNLDEEKRNSFEGMKYEVRKVKDGRKVILLRLPPPQESREVYFMALVDRPQKHSVLPWRNLARIFALSLSKGSDGEPSTIFCEVTRTARYIPMGEGMKPTAKVFYNRVSNILDRKLKLGWL